VTRLRSFTEIGISLATIAVLMTFAVRLQRERDVRYPPPETTEETLYLTSGAALQRLSLGYRSLAADLYWIRAIQHFGGTRQSLYVPGQEPIRPAGPEPYRLLHPLLDIATTLDPYFTVAYRFGSLFLAEPFPGGPGRPDLAIALLEKGLAAEPDKWEYMHDIGFVYYWWLRDYRTAGVWFEKAGAVPGAPWWMRSMAAVTLANGGARNSSRQLWQEIAQSATVEYQRNHAQRALAQLQALDDLDQLRLVVERYSQTAGRPPGDWATLIRAGMLPGVPLDPTTTPYTIDANGTVDLARESTLFPLPQEPQGSAPRQ
jgi:hypothetical protein